MTPLDVLRASTFGKRTAEEERDQLQQYFVETEQWNSVYKGDIDVVYGAKGSGKSAIYSLIVSKEDKLFDNNIIVVPAENPQGAPAFQNLNTDPPNNEFEFVSLWKLYIITVCGEYIREYGLKSDKCNKIVQTLQDADLLPSGFSLAKALRYTFDYVKRLTRDISGVEGIINIDPATGMPSGVSGKILLREPTASQAKLGIVSIDELFDTANKALSEKGFTLWVLLDRLDAAFADRPELEIQALRALFKCYLDIKGFQNIRLKIFLRTDIWSRITRDGFREASHIERSLTIEWKQDDLMNLVVQRLLSNGTICKFYNINKDEILVDFARQEEFFYRVFPKQVDSGKNKPTSFKWILSRTKDAIQSAAPRELIHFLNELRDTQIGRLERGVPPPTEDRLFEQIAFKEALPGVGRTRLEQTLYAEFPSSQRPIEALREQKATQTLKSLCSLWSVEPTEGARIASELEAIGFFEKTGTTPNIEWTIPFLYRPALKLVQGSADKQTSPVDDET